MNFFKNNPVLSFFIMIVLATAIALYINYSYFNRAFKKWDDKRVEELTGKNQEINELKQKLKTNSENAGESFIKLRDYKNGVISHLEYKYGKLRYEYKESMAEKERIISNLRNKNFELQISLIDSRNIVSLLLFQIDLQKFKHQLFLHSIFNDGGWGKEYDARNATCKIIEKRLEYQRWIPKTLTWSWGEK